MAPLAKNANPSPASAVRLCDESRGVSDALDQATQAASPLTGTPSTPSVPAPLALALAGVGLWEVDPVSGTMLHDARFQAIVGFDEAAPTFASFLTAVHEDDRERFEDALARACGTPSSGRIEIAFRTAADADRWLVAAAQLTFERDGTARLLGTVVGVHGHVLDLLAEARATMAAAKAERRGTEDRLAFVSHELRQPVSAIIGWARMLLSDEDSLADADRTRLGLRVITRQAKVQERLVDDILDLTRSRTGKLSLTMNTLDLRKTLESALRGLCFEAGEKDIELRPHFEPELGSMIGDVDRVTQIFVNLLTNAIKFTPRGGHVDVFAVRRMNQIVVTVSDTGEGIEPHLLPFVFDRFWQTPGSPSTAKGLGLGLAIVRELVERHSGSVTASSEGYGLGATFRVTFPALDDDRAKRPREHVASKREASLGGVSILVVEDDRDALDLTVGLLECAGARVTTASSLEGAMRCLETSRPDVIVSDVGLPDASSDGLLDRVRAHPRPDLRTVPVIALTGYTRRNEGMTSGHFDAYLVKPVGPRDLIDAVARIAAGSRRVPT